MVIPFEREEVNADGSERAPPTVPLVKPVQPKKCMGKCLERLVNACGVTLKKMQNDRVGHAITAAVLRGSFQIMHHLFSCVAEVTRE